MAIFTLPAAGELAKVLLRLLVPHPTDTPDVIYRWRISVSGIVGGLLIMNILIVALLLGSAIPLFPTLAHAQDVQQIIARQERSEKRDLETALYDAVKEECENIHTSNLALASIKEKAIRDMEAQYVELPSVKARYERPPCYLFVQQQASAGPPPQ